jgi:hypothetical protein
MNIDERLEALTQTVELIAHAQTKADEKIKQLTALQSETAGFINQLARIAESHEHRIERLADEAREADKRLGERVETLVSTVGALIRQLPKQ